MGDGACRVRAVLGMALLATLAACGGQEPVVETPRPVLVMHPAAGADTAPAAYAGDIRARNESPLSFRVGGNLVKRLVDAGDRVRRGQLLAELDPGDAALQASAAQAEMTRIGGDLERYRKLVAQKLVSQSTFDAQQAAYRAARAQYELARNQSAYTRLHAPRDGVIATRSAEAGQTVAAGQAIYTLAGDVGREVAIALPESRIRKVSVGQQLAALDAVAGIDQALDQVAADTERQRALVACADVAGVRGRRGIGACRGMHHQHRARGFDRRLLPAAAGERRQQCHPQHRTHTACAVPHCPTPRLAPLLDWPVEYKYRTE